MKRNKKEVILELSRKNGLNIIDRSILYMIFTIPSYGDINFIKLFINNYYGVEELPTEFYKLFSYTLNSPQCNELLGIVSKKEKYGLSGLENYLRNAMKYKDNMIEHRNPQYYYGVPYSKVEELVDLINGLKYKDDSLPIKEQIKDNINWKLKRGFKIDNPNEALRIAIIMYLSLGLDNARELLLGKYGQVDYEILIYLFTDLEVKDKDENSIGAFRSFFFDNKKDPNNNMRLMLEGKLLDIFINFDYFFNSIEYFINELGININRNKLSLLLRERYVSSIIESPELDGVIQEDMISSYHNKIDIYESSEEIIEKNKDAYNEKLKNKSSSSIKRVDIPKINDYTFEMIPLSDPRNLVMGYRAGNCFRLNGDAFLLFNKFLTNPHMRILSISTDEYKDFGMVLLMRNGNVLILQGIETSKRVPQSILGEKLYMAVRDATKYIMDRINEEDDEIVASIIGLTNGNTIPYNHNILPFIINPLLDNNHQYYNGIDSYQGLLSLKDGRSLNDIKLFVPDKLYSERSTIWRRDNNTSHNSIEYRTIEKILISLRYARFMKTSKEEMIYYYNELANSKEKYTVCSLHWHITVFEDGSIDSYINSNNQDIINEYEEELVSIKGISR